MLRSEIKQRWYDLGQRRCYCGRQLVWRFNHKNSATVEHIIPKSVGGTYNQRNTLIVCRECNSLRGDTPFMDWVMKVKPPKEEWLLRKCNEATEFYSVRKEKK